MHFVSLPIFQIRSNKEKGTHVIRLEKNKKKTFEEERADVLRFDNLLSLP